MRIRQSAISLLVALIVSACGVRATPEVATACAALQAPDPGLSRSIDGGAIDQWRIDEAVRHEVNRVRCDRGLAPMAGDPAIARAASYHSGDMVQLDFFDHISPVSGRRTPSDRFREVGAGFSSAAENIARTSLYEFNGATFILRDPAACAFSFTPNGPLIERRSYIGAAERLVAQWMKSSGHRRNILDPGLTRHGAGAAFLADPRTCGELVVTQNFAN